MKPKYTSVIAVMGLLIATGVHASETIQCKSWDNLKEKISIDIQLHGELAIVNLDFDGTETTTPAIVRPWHNYTPNRCASRASGLEFDLPLPNVHHLHIVTQTYGTGCYEPSMIGIYGTEDPFVYLTCEGLPE